jgi:hypothetical protein
MASASLLFNRRQLVVDSALRKYAAHPESASQQWTSQTWCTVRFLPRSEDNIQQGGIQLPVSEICLAAISCSVELQKDVHSHLR